MRAWLPAVAFLLLAAAPASAAPRLVKIGDFTDPVHVAAPSNDPRVFVVEQAGLVKIAGGGTFIDLTGPTESDALEQGLLSIAFSPNYASTGLFYVFMTAEGGNVEVREYRRSATDPNVADPNPVRTLFAAQHNAPNHNGGQLQFGPDGALYASIGDDAVPANAQDATSPFGKILRIDLAAGNWTIWSSGLRNPWRFSFDPPTGDLLIGDVGGSLYEEINSSRGPNAGQGINYGWPCNEGPNGADSCGARAAFWHPIGAWRAIVGGYVVRDPGLPTLNGRYLYGDNVQTGLWSTVLGTGAGAPTGLTVSGLSSFGTNSSGHIFVASRGSDAVYRIQDAASAVAPVPAPVDATAPELGVRLLRPVLKNRRLRLALRCDEACRVAIAARLRGVRRLSTRHRSLAANKRTVVALKLSRKTARRARRAVRRRGFVRVVLTVRATDAAGNRSSAVTRRGRIKRRR